MHASVGSCRAAQSRSRPPVARAAAQVEQSVTASHHHRSSSSATNTSSHRPIAHAAYAFVKLGGVRQMLQEGHAYTCPARYLHAARVPAAAAATPAAAPAAGAPEERDRYVFAHVLGVRAGGSFRWGKPYVPGTCVEVEVLEEFEGPAPSCGSAAVAEQVARDVTLARYRVTAISTEGCGSGNGSSGGSGSGQQ